MTSVIAKHYTSSSIRNPEREEWRDKLRLNNASLLVEKWNGAWVRDRDKLPHNFFRVKFIDNNGLLN